MAVDSFRAPGNGRGRGGFRLTAGLAKPNALLEQIWNIAEIGVGGFTYFGKLPSEELFPAHRRFPRHPHFISGRPAVCTGPNLTIFRKSPNNTRRHRGTFRN